MIQEVTFNGERILPLCHGAALVASKSEWGGWHAVKVVDGARKCDCLGYQKRHACRHVKTLDAFEETQRAEAREREEVARRLAEQQAREQEAARVAAERGASWADEVGLWMPERPHTPRIAPARSFEEIFGFSKPAAIAAA